MVAYIRIKCLIKQLRKMNNKTEQIINLADNKVQSDLERAKRLCAELQNVTYMILHIEKSLSF